MQLNFSIETNRPIISMQIKTMYVDCLLDTGAFMPVWCDTIEQLLYVFPNCYYSRLVTVIGGFGKGNEYAPVYIIPDFVFSDGTNTIHYKNLPVAVLEKPFSFQLILSYNMFTTANLSINTFATTPNVHKIKPHILIKYQRPVLGVNLTRKNTVLTKPLPYNAIGIAENILVFYQR